MQPVQSVPFFSLARAARREAGLSQAVLAEKAGCRQSQISAFEAGVPGKISREATLRIAETLGLEPPPEPQPPADGASASAAAGLSGAASAWPAPAGLAEVSVPFCPDFQCLSNMPYFIGEQLLFLPLGFCGGGVRCAVCGEVLQRRCPSCGGRFRGHGGCCETCGRPLVELPEGVAADPREWAAAQRAAVSDFAAMAAPRAGVVPSFAARR